MRLVGLLIGMALVTAPVGMAEAATRIDEVHAPTRIAAAGGMAMWSAYVSASPSGSRLRLWDGLASHEPALAPAPGGFDGDLVAGRTDRTTIVYSRCRNGVSAGTPDAGLVNRAYPLSCHLRLADPGNGSERVIVRARRNRSAVFPAASGTTAYFVDVPLDDTGDEFGRLAGTPSVWRVRLSGGRPSRVAAVAGGWKRFFGRSSGMSTTWRPVGLDVSGRRLAITRQGRTRRGRMRTEVLLFDTITARLKRIARAEQRAFRRPTGVADDYRQFSAPAVDGSTVAWSEWGRHDRIWTYSVPLGRARSHHVAPGASPVAVALSGAGLFWTSARPYDAVFPCGGTQYDEAPGDACALWLDRAIRD